MNASRPRVVTIIAGTSGDLDAMARLADAIWREHYPGILTPAQIDYMLERGYSPAALAKFVREPGAGFAFAHVEGVSVGFAAWYRTGEPATTKLDKLYVLPVLHRQGVGTKLIAHVETQARRDGARTLVLNVNKCNAGAIAAYLARGFTTRDSVVVDIGGGFVMDDYVMAKPL